MPAATNKTKIEETQPASAKEEPDEHGGGLPLVSVLDQGTMDIAKEMLIEAEAIRTRVDADNERLKEIKDTLIGIAEAFELPGMRWGQIGLQYNGYQTKRTLDKGKLLENGVDASVIAASYSESKPFVNARFVTIRG